MLILYIVHTSLDTSIYESCHVMSCLIMLCPILSHHIVSYLGSCILYRASHITQLDGQHMCRIILYHFTTYPKYPNPCVEGDVHCSRCNIVLIKLKYGPKCKHQHSGWANPQQNGSDFFLIDSYNIYIYIYSIYIYTYTCGI